MSFKCLRFVAAAVLCLATATTAGAEGFALYEYSARGVALGGAVVARQPDVSAIAYNPALIARLPGKHLMVGASLARPSGKMSTTDAAGRRETTSLRNAIWPLPHFYYSHQINDKITLGIGEFTRFGLGFEYPSNWPGRFNIYEVSLMSGSLNPNIALRATDKLSLAAGVEVMYVTLDMKKRARVGVPHGGPQYVGAFEVDSNIQNADAFGVGFNLAAHYQFTDQWAAGISYRSRVRVHAKGDLTYTYMGYTDLSGHPQGEALAQGTYAQMFHNGQADSTVWMPASVSLGLSWTPTPKFSIEVGATWTEWSSFKALNINVPAPIYMSPSQKDWKDVWRVQVGLEYAALDWLTLRAGYVYDKSPMTERYSDYLVPTHDRHIFSVGAGFKYDSWTCDLAYSYVQPKLRSYRASDETKVLSSKAHTSSRTDIISLSIGYSF